MTLIRVSAFRWVPPFAQGLVLAGLLVAVLHPGQQGAQSAFGTAGGRVAVGDSASVTPAATLRTEDNKRGLKLPLPDKPFPGQSKPPCKRTGEVEIRGGCWIRLDAKPPCKEEGKEDAFLWKGACYGPALPVGREPTSNPP